MSKKIEAHQCDYCNKVTRTKSGITNHEKSCKLNPQVQSCHTCANFIEFDNGGWGEATGVYATLNNLPDYMFCLEINSPFYNKLFEDEHMWDNNPLQDHIGGYQKGCESWKEKTDKYGKDADRMINWGGAKVASYINLPIDKTFFDDHWDWLKDEVEKYKGSDVGWYGNITQEQCACHYTGVSGGELDEYICPVCKAEQAANNDEIPF